MWSEYFCIERNNAFMCLFSLDKRLALGVRFGGETGIRTLGTLARSTVFETVFGQGGDALPLIYMGLRELYARVRQVERRDTA